MPRGISCLTEIQKQEIIADALKKLYDSKILTDTRNKKIKPLDKDLDFAYALYQRISETPGFSHRKDYGNDGLHTKLQKKLGITVLAPTKPPSRSR